MQSRILRPSLALLAALPCLASCKGYSTLSVRQDGGLKEVDTLLAKAERVQVESVVTKERAQAALEQLRVLLAPEFKGDPAAGHLSLVKAIEVSRDQAEALQGSVKPLKRTGESVFADWTRNLESFGNISMRQRSQERLEETRKRFDAILSAAISCQLAVDAFNGDLTDHALFLEHDFNATSVAMIAGELDGLRARGKELARRLDACAAACQAFIEFAAPGHQTASTEPVAAPEAPAEPSLPPPPQKKPVKKKTQTKPTAGETQTGG